MFAALGKVTIPAAGTPVKLLDRLSTAQKAKIQAYNTEGPIHGVLLQAWKGNVGGIYIGDSPSMSKSDGTDVAAYLIAPSTNQPASFSMALTRGPNPLALGDIYLDADTSTDGVLVSVLVN